MFEFHPEAEAEFDDAYEWYRSRSATAAVDFDAAVYRAISEILDHPDAYREDR